MFAKLKQKIAEEETSDGSNSQSSSPQPRRKPKPRINGHGENKWDQRRLPSTASLYESKESVFSDLSSTSGYGSRKTSFSSRPATLTPTWAPTDSTDSPVGPGSSREELLAMLSQKTEQVTKLEQKIQGMASLLKEHSRAKEFLEEKLEQQKQESNQKLLDLEEEYEQRIAKIKSGHEKTLKQKTQDLHDKDKAHASESNRFEDLRELHGLQEQELTRMKSLFIQYQTDSTKKAAEILEKNKQLDDLDKEYAKQKNVLESLQERLDDLSRERIKYETREKQLQTKITNIEKENTSLRDELNKSVSELTQKSLQLTRVEKLQEQVEMELNSVRQSYTLYKNQTSAQLHEKQVKIDNLEERNGDLERRLQDCRLSGNDKYESIERERQTLEERLSEARQQLIDLRAGSNDRINTLGSLVSTLNERLERKESALTETKRMHEHEVTSLKEKISSLEDQLSSTKHLLQDKTSESEKIQTLIKKNEKLERDLEQARQNLHGSSKSADEQISNMESEIHRLEESRIEEQSEMQKRMERLSEIEKEYSIRADQYKLRIADLEEEKEQLQSELDAQTEELRQVSLCLEDAMTRTNELKSQIGIFEENLKTKDDLLTCTSDKDSSDASLSMNSADAVNALRVDLDNFRMRCKKSEEALHEREKMILQLRNTLKEKEDIINRSTTRLKQYEENNWLARNDKIYASDARDSHRVIAALRQQVKDLQQQLNEREMLQLDEKELKELRLESRRQDSELQEKEKKIKLLQAKLAELKKAFQRELKLPVPGDDVPPSPATPDSPGSDTMSAAEKDRMEYLDMNFKYLKHVILKYMCGDNKQSRQLINVISHMLRFSPNERKCVLDALEWKLPLE